MRQHLLWASATLALVIAACGGSSPTSQPSPTNSCVNATAAHHAYVVVQHLSGATLQKCVGFSGGTIAGQALMDQSGIEYQAQTTSLGKAVCQVDREPAQFSTCFPQDQPYWALFIEAGGAWTMAPSGLNGAVLHDKDAIGWHYVGYDPKSDPSPPPLANQS